MNEIELNQLENVSLYALDVTDEASIAGSTEQILSDFGTVDVVLLRINAFQAMVIHDAYGEMPIVGKPQCHIIPMSKEDNHIAISTGCMLSRVRTGMAPDEMTCTIPANRLAEVIRRLAARKAANSAVTAYANDDLRRFA